MQKEIINAIPNVEILNTFKSGGHDCFSAIEDIIDNALETYVNARKVKVYLESDENSKAIKKIAIIDDGIGMNKPTICQAVKLASKTGKNTAMFGCYGVGLKASAATIGKKLKIISKQNNTPLYSIVIDREKMITQQTFDLELIEDNPEDWKIFMDYGNFESGTVIIIEDLYEGKINGQKMISAIYPKLFVQLGIVYNKILEKRKDLTLLLNDVKVFSINPILSDIEDLKCHQVNVGDDTFEYNSNQFIAKVYDVSADTSLNKALVRQTFENAIKEYYNYSEYQSTPDFDKVLNEIYNQTKLSIRNSGLYTYRNDRLTGFGLDMGIIEKGGDGYRNRLRIELFYNGSSDYLFCSSFNKIVADRKSALNDEFKDALLDKIVEYRNQVVRDARKRSDVEREKQMDKDKEAERIKTVIEENLNNPLSVIENKDENENKDNIEEVKDDTIFDNENLSTKKNNFNPEKDLIKKPKNKYSINVEYQELGEDSIICDYRQNGTEVNFVLNQSSPFIKEMYMAATENERFFMNQLLFGVCSSIRNASEYYDNPDSVYTAFMKQITKRINTLVLK